MYNSVHASPGKKGTHAGCARVFAGPKHTGAEGAEKQSLQVLAGKFRPRVTAPCCVLCTLASVFVFTHCGAVVAVVVFFFSVGRFYFRIFFSPPYYYYYHYLFFLLFFFFLRQSPADASFYNLNPADAAGRARLCRTRVPAVCGRNPSWFSIPLLYDPQRPAYNIYRRELHFENGTND